MRRSLSLGPPSWLPISISGAHLSSPQPCFSISLSSSSSQQLRLPTQHRHSTTPCTHRHPLEHLLYPRSTVSSASPPDSGTGSPSQNPSHVHHPPISRITIRSIIFSRTSISFITRRTSIQNPSFTTHHPPSRSSPSPSQTHHISPLVHIPAQIPGLPDPPPIFIFPITHLTHIHPLHHLPSLPSISQLRLPRNPSHTHPSPASSPISPFHLTIPSPPQPISHTSIPCIISHLSLPSHNSVPPATHLTHIHPLHPSPHLSSPISAPITLHPTHLLPGSIFFPKRGPLRHHSSLTPASSLLHLLPTCPEPTPSQLIVPSPSDPSQAQPLQPIFSTLRQPPPSSPFTEPIEAAPPFTRNAGEGEEAI
ncbi:hypothetical protein MRB53_036070 [Persea americana]|uniref:Uncharacterized protein n=1 Tax=Persea americana TaxID=3435 RepID=A0ACC2K6N0_PERAE|nr:hypothetical protein MRB53_036070 [Persea americana]